MIDYKSLYYALFNSVKDAIESLKKAQIEAEQMYIELDESVKVRNLPPKKEKE